jgi:enamine deaminase RidA (YjgF/YER057c/UK114 family)
MRGMERETAEGRLMSKGIALPEASEPAARYTNAVVTNGLLFISGKGPAGSPSGKLGSEYTTEAGYRFARLAGLEVLAVVKKTLGDLDRVSRVVKVQGYVNADPSFTEHHLVLDGYSDLLYEVFGEKGITAARCLGRIPCEAICP